VEEPVAGGRGGVFGESRAEQTAPVDLTAVHAKIGELALENDFVNIPQQNRGIFTNKSKNFHLREKQKLFELPAPPLSSDSLFTVCLLKVKKDLTRIPCTSMIASCVWLTKVVVVAPRRLVLWS
jgi:hypothetical protein